MSFNSDTLMQALRRDLGNTKNFQDSSSSKHVAAFMLQQNLTKKFTDGTTSRLAEDAAVEKFTTVNLLVGQWVEPVNQPVVARILERTACLFSKQYFDTKGAPSMSIAKAFNIGMVGPGASIGATADNLIDKLFNSTLTCTDPILHKYYLEAIANMKPWRKAEVIRQRIHGNYRIVKGNKLFFVPKETVIARTAATEPTLNMFGQKGYGNLIENKLKEFHDIDLSIQQNINKWMARSGSLNGELATIDLSSASDTIGVRFLETLLPARMLKDLMLLRSPSTMVRGKEVELKMISTMGNGFTFPLETWIFANLVLATFIETGEPVFDIYGKRRYSVFGDDIIVPSGIYEIVTQVLSAAGFTVNLKKSFSTGKFRESCGGDYFNGVNVRAIYLKEYTDQTHGYSLINRLLDWSGIHGISLIHTLKYLSSLVEFRPIPLSEDETSGIRVPLARLTRRKTSSRGNFIYYKREQIVKSFTPEPVTVERYYHAFHVAFLHGSYRDGHVTSRVKPGCEVFKVVKRECPISWDFSHDARLTTEERRNTFETNFPIR